jgi:hypothetical protein
MSSRSLRFRVMPALLPLIFAQAHAVDRARMAKDEMTILNVDVGRNDTLANVVARLGKAREWHTGDASESESKICYKISTDHAEVIVVFASNGEMSSPKGQVTSIRLYGEGAAFPQRRHCARLAVPSEAIGIANGLKLGLTPDDVRTILGPEQISKRQSLSYTHCAKKYWRKSDPFYRTWVGQSQCFEDPGRPYFNDCSFVEIRFLNGVANYVSFNRNQSVC